MSGIWHIFRGSEGIHGSLKYPTVTTKLSQKHHNEFLESACRQETYVVDPLNIYYIIWYFVITLLPGVAFSAAFCPVFIPAYPS